MPTTVSITRLMGNTALPADTPRLSLIMPCYNEDQAVGYSIPRLLGAFRTARINLQLITVDNGSTDRTRKLLTEFAANNPEVSLCALNVNQGYGNGILQGIPLCSGEWLGFVHADGQVDPEDVVRLFEAAAATDGNVLAKVCRRFRMDGWKRKIVSGGYNVLVRMLWPGLPSADINGSPKLLKRDHALALNLQSKDWFLAPEIMIKAHRLGLRVLELNVFARMRSNGLSHVRVGTCWEFLVNLLKARLTPSFRATDSARSHVEQASR